VGGQVSYSLKREWGQIPEDFSVIQRHLPTAETDAIADPWTSKFF
jgi:hypothetical protein